MNIDAIKQDLSRARTMFGPLQPESIQKLLAVVLEPNRETWDAAHGLLLHPKVTLWQAVCEYDPSMSHVGPTHDLKGRCVKPWGKIPTREVLLSAIRYATR